jgi:5,10-methylenetetrahydrofolate reductase
MFSSYKKLEKRHGADKLIGIMQRIIDNLEQEDMLRPEVSNVDVRKRSEELYEEIREDYHGGFDVNQD